MSLTPPVVTISGGSWELRILSWPMRVYASTDCTRRAEYRRGGNAAKISFSGCKRLTDAMADRRSVSPEMRRAVSYAGFFLTGACLVFRRKPVN